MINIITKYSGDKRVIRDFDSFFEGYVLAKDFGVLDEKALKQVDDAEILDKSLGSVKTKFGLTDVLHLSTGCKVVLSYLYIMRNRDKYSDIVLDITMCGNNALEVLFDCVDSLEDSTSIFLLRHQNGLRYCTERDFSINGNCCTNLRKGIAKFG